MVPVSEGGGEARVRTCKAGHPSVQKAPCTPAAGPFFLLKKCLRFIYLFLRERERERGRTPTMQALSTEPDAGLRLTDHKTTT